ncbi:MAG: acyltransferase family protein [Gammaproteobacteria bacterium]|nr:acyltransferase [Rhodocyclaceae bacterium]MBU3908651.1 acyltransferase family protein [Gammaproteobacteria bacterium]MBU3988103.1 acyltransferase family protein [Gammaproteobacteria bacterium]MBU4004679.1 acyltransferase family protein [Gammaproteobacteria bacterium]MBU4021282.1 acyltransferase family protein [Gammaproteobacteria bacterium]
MHSSSRVPLIDTIKAVAAQLIVLHHLAWFGPMSDVAATASPLLSAGQSWLAEYGRYAVAAFLAVAGYLAAQSLSPRGLPLDRSPFSLIIQRYLRLVGPYAVALLLAMVSAALARQLMVHDSIGAAPDLGQFFAHLFLLHDLLDFEALSAGVWYIAIDFQLYALMVALMWIAARLQRRTASPTGISSGHADFVGPLLIAMVAFASLFFFNQRDAWDATALYFFGAYALGVGSSWAVQSARPYWFLSLVALIGMATLMFDFRPRIAVALVVALTLGLAHLHMRSSMNNGSTVLASLSRTSYALFLVHFPVCLLINAAFHHLAPHNPMLNALGIVVAWGASNLAAILFYRHIEVRLSVLWQKRPKPRLGLQTVN